MRRDISSACTTDAERILRVLVSRMAYASTIYGPMDKFDDMIGAVKIQGSGKPEVGDLVIGQTMSEIGILKGIERGENEFCDKYFIQPIGTDRIVSWSNEKFNTICGLRPSDLLIGDEWRFYRMAFQASDFRDDPGYWQRVCDVTFDGETAKVAFRERYGGRRGDNRLAYIDDPNYRRFLKYKTPRSLHTFLKDQGWGSKTMFPEMPSNAENTQNGKN